MSSSTQTITSSPMATSSFVSIPTDDVSLSQTVRRLVIAAMFVVALVSLLAAG